MRFYWLTIVHTSLLFNCPSHIPEEEGGKIALSIPTHCWKGSCLWRPRTWLCCHVIYQVMREHLRSLQQNRGHNPELKSSLNLSCTPRPLQGSSSCWIQGSWLLLRGTHTGVVHHAVLLLRPAFHASFALWDFIYLFREKARGKI